jgi:hypothetical protein
MLSKAFLVEQLQRLNHPFDTALHHSGNLTRIVERRRDPVASSAREPVSRWRRHIVEIVSIDAHRDV